MVKRPHDLPGNGETAFHSATLSAADAMDQTATLISMARSLIG